MPMKGIYVIFIPEKCLQIRLPTMLVLGRLPINVKYVYIYIYKSHNITTCNLYYLTKFDKQTVYASTEITFLNDQSGIMALQLFKLFENMNVFIIV